MPLTKLKMLSIEQYIGADKKGDPIPYYQWPVIGALYRRRVELCLSELRGGERILEVGFGSGVTFLNLGEMYQEIHGLDLMAKVDKVTTLFKKLGVDVRLRNGDVLKMPYPNDHFDSELLISILEHLRPQEQAQAFQEIRRVLRPGGQLVYGVPVERSYMTMMFHLLGYDIRQYHFSTENDVAEAAQQVLMPVRIILMKSVYSLGLATYEVGHFIKA